MSVSADKRFRAALVQLRSGRSVEANLDAAESLIRRAAKGGAIYVQTPENTGFMELEPEQTLLKAQTEPENVALTKLRALAAELGIYLHIGSLAIKEDGPRVANRSYLIDPEGEIIARYDKLHMFDVDLAGGESHRESAHCRPGAKAVVVDLPFGRLGLSICYDLRFPQLFRALANSGAEFIAVPAAFTRQTGEAHWHVLIRARAIETGAFVLAATQGGQHESGRATFGHSLIVSPWGEILAEAGEEPGVVFADIDLEASAEARARIPNLRHGRDFEVEIAKPSKQAARGKRRDRSTN
jgi:predicted amidohydrolase